MFYASSKPEKPGVRASFLRKIIEESDNPEQYILRLLWYNGYNPVKKRYHMIREKMKSVS
jgi:hypothetical protein